MGGWEVGGGREGWVGRVGRVGSDRMVGWRMVGREVGGWLGEPLGRNWENPAGHAAVTLSKSSQGKPC